MFKFFRNVFHKIFTRQPIIVSVEKEKEEKIEKNSWTILSFVQPDEEKILKIEYSDEIGTRRTTKCKAIFESNSQYKLVAPWLGSGVILQKGNLTDLKIEKVNK